MAAVLAAFTKWRRNASHSIATPAPIWKPGRLPDQCSHFRGESGHVIGPTAGAHHLAIVYRPKAFGASDLIGAGGQLLGEATSAQ